MAIPRLQSLGEGRATRIVTRLELEALPRVDNNGIYQAMADSELPGVRAVLDGQLEPFSAAPTRAVCNYVDPNAARRYGLGDLLGKAPFPVNAAFLKALSDRFALRPVAEAAPGAETVTVRASRYVQSERNLGDGRGGYIVRATPDGTTATLFAKGIGQTPLCKPAEAQAGHSDGYISSHSSLAESIWPQLFHHLFTHSTPVTVAFFGTEVFGREFEPRIPYEEQAVILLRGGQMLRPAHFTEQGVYDRVLEIAGAQKSANPNDWTSVPWRILSQPIPLDGLKGTMPSIDPFLRAAHATGVLRYRTVPQYGEVPDLRATFAEIVDRFALTAAESWGWRWMQSAPSAGNAELGGGLIDVETASSNPRTGQMYVLSYSFPFGHSEYTWRAVAVKMMWESLRLNMTTGERQFYNAAGDLDFAQLHGALYSQHLSEQYLKAMGLKTEVVAELMKHSFDDVSRFQAAMHTLATMENEGPIPYVMTREGRLLEDAEAIVTSRSVVDVFGFLGRWPQIYFDAVARGEKPTLEQAVSALEPIYSSSPEVHTGQESNVRQLAHDLMVTYDRLMRAAETHGASHYDDASSMHADVAARAAFRNKPMDAVYYWRVRSEIVDTLGTIDPNTGRTVFADRDYLWPAVHSKVELSKRNVDAMLRDGEVVSGDNGQVDLGVMMYGNTTYGIHADPTSGARQLFVHIPVGNVDGPYELNVTGNGMSLASIDGAKILYRMTENGQVVAQGEAQAARIEKGGHLYLGLDVPVSASAYGVFEATLEIPGGPSRRLFEYAYASPDNATVRQLTERLPKP